jgi:hypothetical protein
MPDFYAFRRIGDRTCQESSGGDDSSTEKELAHSRAALKVGLPFLWISFYLNKYCMGGTFFSGIHFIKK